MGITDYLLIAAGIAIAAGAVFVLYAMIEPEVELLQEWLADAKARKLCRRALELRETAELHRKDYPLSARELDRMAAQHERDALELRRARKAP